MHFSNKTYKFVFILIIFIGSYCLALENGLGRTPPMGWLTWQRYRCQTDCKNYPDDCIDEKLIKTTADIMVTDGYLKMGYNYIIIDDCWLAKERDSNGRLQADSERFPNGMKSLADYVHSKGLKFGIYGDIGPKTCAGYPGSEHYLQLDAATFADWGVDYLKFDACYYPPEQYKFGYPPMAFYLNMTKRSIFFSCEYPLYQRAVSTPNYTLVSESCNTARNYNDVDDSWDSVLDIMNFYARNQGNFIEEAKPGYFNDPDMLIIGNFGLSESQERVQMALWSLMAAPLLMSTDLSRIRASSKAILQNKLAIFVNQDPLGIQAKRVNVIGKIEIWTKAINPKGSYAIALVNLETGAPRLISVTLTAATQNDKYWKNKVGNADLQGYNVTEVFSGKSEGFVKAKESISKLLYPNDVYFAIVAAVFT